MIVPSLVVVVGLVMGSFAGMSVYRIPRRQSIALRSACPHCKERLRIRELVPVASYLVAGGRCAHCQNRVSPTYPLIELLSGVLALLTWLRFGFTVDGLIWLLIALGLLVIVAIDAEFLMIPNTIVAGVAFGGCVLLAGHAPEGMVIELAAAVGVSASVFMLSLLVSKSLGRQSIGMGDIKLIGSLAISIGASATLATVWVASLYGMALTMMHHGRKRGQKIAFGSCLASVALVFIVLEWTGEL